MSYLWVFGRRPSCLVRYRHGGESALYPPVLYHHAEAVVAAARAARAGAIAENPMMDNVVPFPGKPVRPARTGPARSSGRSKAKSPKKRD